MFQITDWSSKVSWQRISLWHFLQLYNNFVYVSLLFSIPYSILFIHWILMWQPVLKWYSFASQLLFPPFLHLFCFFPSWKNTTTFRDICPGVHINDNHRKIGEFYKSTAGGCRKLKIRVSLLSILSSSPSLFYFYYFYLPSMLVYEIANFKVNFMEFPKVSSKTRVGYYYIAFLYSESMIWQTLPIVRQSSFSGSGHYLLIGSRFTASLL